MPDTASCTRLNCVCVRACVRACGRAGVCACVPVHSGVWCLVSGVCACMFPGASVQAPNVDPKLKQFQQPTDQLSTANDGEDD